MDWVRDVRATLKNSEEDFHQVKGWIYWRDMFVGAIVAYGAAMLYMQAPAYSVWQLLSLIHIS